MNLKDEAKQMRLWISDRYSGPATVMNATIEAEIESVLRRVRVGTLREAIKVVDHARGWCDNGMFISNTHHGGVVDVANRTKHELERLITTLEQEQQR